MNQRILMFSREIFYGRLLIISDVQGAGTRLSKNKTQKALQLHRKTT